jgi:transcriptional regulator with XRE-family HTH domain
MSDESDRLRDARKAAGFATAQEAAQRFGWTYPTYSGHENGNRGIKPEARRAYARAFRVDASWLIEGTGRGPSSTTPPARTSTQPAFSESEAAPFIHKNPGQQNKLADLAAAITPGVRHRQLYVATSPSRPFAILQGDILVIGTPGEERNGDVVLATLALPGPQDGRTVLRQRSGKHLVAPVGSALPDEEHRSAGVLGTVVAVIRAPKVPELID